MRHVFRTMLALAVLLVGVSLAPAATAATSASGSVSVLGSCNYNGSHPTLSQGSSGAAVLHAQCLLNAVHGRGITQDGEFGPGTATAVRWVQGHCNLSVDGIIGPNTWDALHPDTTWC
ncbi:peptidoglycan-binding domain-containing protein [Streptomyces sedi]|nr:peptidoglycan-binding domain-containing protein [Streptomyces sedi]